MKTTSAAIAMSILLTLCACGPAAPAATFPPQPTDTSVPPPPTAAPTLRPEPSETPIPPTPTPLRVLLRRRCGGEYLLTPNTPVEIMYGGWGVTGREVAEQWLTNLEVDLTIDGLPVLGELQPIADELPLNCTQDPEGIYWIYFSVLVPGFSSGEHPVTVAFRALRPLPDGSGLTFGPGEILKQDFTLSVR